MRAILRMSVNGEGNGALRNRLVQILEGYGFESVNNVTATWEHMEITTLNLGQALSQFWAVAANPQATAGAAEGVHLDGMWLHVDEKI